MLVYARSSILGCERVTLTLEALSNSEAVTAGPLGLPSRQGDYQVDNVYFGATIRARPSTSRQLQSRTAECKLGKVRPQLVRAPIKEGTTECHVLGVK
jgi:hypothetical protein